MELEGVQGHLGHHLEDKSNYLISFSHHFSLMILMEWTITKSCCTVSNTQKIGIHQFQKVKAEIIDCPRMDKVSFGII